MHGAAVELPGYGALITTRSIIAIHKKQQGCYICIMSKLHVNQVRNHIVPRYEKYIDVSDLAGRPADEVLTATASRCFCAFALESTTGIESRIASLSITDGFGDWGIDALYIDETNYYVHIVQSKLIQDGSGGPELGDIEKTIRGVKRIIDLNFSDFNVRLKKKEADIARALNDTRFKILLTIAYTGTKLSDEAKSVLNEFKEENNEAGEIFYINEFDLKRAHSIIRDGASNTIIDAEILLENWGKITEPSVSFYGTLNGEDVARLYKKHYSSLFSRNIRFFLGDTEVNKGIEATIRTTPLEFFYLNNGITIISGSVLKKPIGGSDTSSGIFECKSISVVNGAQTFSTIGRLASDGVDVSKIKVFAKIISLENSTTGFDNKVTIAANSQNKVERKDFVSLDPVQEALKTDFAMDGIRYMFKRTNEDQAEKDDVIYLEEATIALAANYSDEYTAIAKREIGRLWLDGDKKQYSDLFNETTKHTQILRLVRILRKVFALCKSAQQASQTSREKSFYIYGNILLLRLVLLELGKAKVLNPNVDLISMINDEIPLIFERQAKSLSDTINATYPDSVFGFLFKNLAKTKAVIQILFPS